MTAAERLTLLKSNLQMITDSNDVYLSHLLEVGEAAIQREGVVDDGTADYESCVIDYAAYLFRKRAVSSANGSNGETAMPRFLRYQLNNILFSQKIREGQS